MVSKWLQNLLNQPFVLSCSFSTPQLPVDGDTGNAFVTVTWLRDAADFVIFYQRVEAAHAALRKSNCCHGPTDPTAFVGKYLELLVIRERIASPLEIGKKMCPDQLLCTDHGDLIGPPRSTRRQRRCRNLR